MIDKIQQDQIDRDKVWDMLLLDGNCSDPTLRGPAKLRRILDDLIEARRALSASTGREITR